MTPPTKLELTWIGKEHRQRVEPRILLEDTGRGNRKVVGSAPATAYENRLIFGDNLLALRALEAEFTGRIKCIYIDPPYNTGSAFTLYDDGMEHSIWLSLMRYLETQLRARGVQRLAGVTGQSEDPTRYAWRFSPESNQKRAQIKPDDELRVLVATDVLSEGQNLQDASIIVNYDLPWAIIRLIQRAGRVDRIGQKSEKINCYSFLPADGVENLIRLRARVRQRLHDNAEVVGTDEAFFEDEREKQKLLDLYHEKAGILDGDTDSDVDLASYAFQIWKNATDKFPELQKSIPELPPVVYSTRAHEVTEKKPAGVLVYLRTAEGNDALAWMDGSGKNVTESQFEILRAAECTPRSQWRRMKVRVNCIGSTGACLATLVTTIA